MYARKLLLNVLYVECRLCKVHPNMKQIRFRVKTFDEKYRKNFKKIQKN